MQLPPPLTDSVLRQTLVLPHPAVGEVSQQGALQLAQFPGLLGWRQLSQGGYTRANYLLPSFRFPGIFKASIDL